MSIKIRIDKVVKDWPEMIKDLKKADQNLTRHPNKPPAHTSQKHLEFIADCKILTQDINIRSCEELLSLEMFVEWTFDKMSPNYRKAKWLAMLGYQKQKYGSYQFPSRSANDPRETQYYNMISLLRNSYRGKTVSIKFDKSIFELPFAKKWIAVKKVKSYTAREWQKVLDFSKQKDGSYIKPKNKSSDPKEKFMYSLIIRFRQALKKDKLEKAVLGMPMAQEWIIGTSSDLEYWQNMIDYIYNKYGKIIKPSKKSNDEKIRSFANKINNWRNAISNDISKKPDQDVLKLPMAKEWLFPSTSPYENLKLKWLDYTNYIFQKYGEYRYPKVSSKDPVEKKFYSYISTVKKRIQDQFTQDQVEGILLLPMAETWLKVSISNTRTAERWKKMLSFIESKYGEYRKPQPLPSDAEERKYYFFVYNLAKKIKKGEAIPETLSDLPMAKEWLT